MARSMTVAAVAGPTDDDQPPFNWATSSMGKNPQYPHVGQNQLWQFRWYNFTATGM